MKVSCNWPVPSCVDVRPFLFRDKLLGIFGNMFRRAAQTGGQYALPSVAALLAQPEFAALQAFVAQRGVDIQELQEAIDELVEHVRQLADSLGR